jgi:hypothetical protein
MHWLEPAFNYGGPHMRPTKPEIFSKPKYQKPVLERHNDYTRVVGLPVSVPYWTPTLFDENGFEGEAFNSKD